MYQAVINNDRRIAKCFYKVQAAFRALEQVGVHCDAGTIFFRSESDVIQEEASGLPYAFYTGQDEFACHGSGGPLFIKFAIENYEEDESRLLEAASLVVQHIRDQGFEVAWDNTIETCIEVNFDSVKLDQVEPDEESEVVLAGIFIHKDLLGKYTSLFADNRFYPNSCEDDYENEDQKVLIEFYLLLLDGESVVEALHRLAPDLDQLDISYFERVFDNGLEMHPMDSMIPWDEEELEEILEENSEEDDEEAD